MRILAIETSCDETAAAVVVDGHQVLSNVVASQIELHRRFGGVYPEVASRQHLLAMVPVLRQALLEAGVDHVRELDAVAVTQGPGLVGSLLVGVNTAKGLSLAAGLPLLPVNHLEGHIYSNWLDLSATPASAGEAEDGPADDFPVIVLIVSGGHTELFLMTDHGRYQRLGGTLDDAAGEAFDKVARLLGLGYPGGPAIQRASHGGDPARFPLPRPLLHGSAQQRFSFSFSGLKTAVLHLVQELQAAGVSAADAGVAADIGASFQQAVAEVLVAKTAAAAIAHQAHWICICGGVSANGVLRHLAQERCRELGIPLRIPPLSLCTDNAAMIGAAAYYRHRVDSRSYLEMDVIASLPLGLN